MASHLFLKTIYLQPLSIMDIIQAYSRWAKNNEIDRQYREMHDIDNVGTAKEIIEEFFIDHQYILTARILLDPTNPSIILLETKAFVYDENSSQIENIREDNDDYLSKDTCIKINAGRSFGSANFAVQEAGPEEILSGGGDISPAQGDAFRDQYMTGVTGWQVMGDFKVSVHKTGCGYDINVYDNNNGSMYTSRTYANTAYRGLNQIAGYLPGFGDAVDAL